MEIQKLLQGFALSAFVFAAAMGSAVALDQKGTLIVALDTLGAQSLDPIQESRASHAHYQAPVFDALLGIDFEKGGIAAGVTERWYISEDGLSWTFHLQEGLKWHNGDPLTAHDVKFSIRRTASEGSLASRAGAIRQIVKEIEVVDDLTVRIHTNGIQVHFPAEVSRAVFQEGQLMPKKYIEEVGEEEFRRNPVGSGPWKFSRSVPGDFIEYKAVDYPHWRGTPNFETMRILQVPEESTRISMVATGEAAIASISPAAIREARAAGLKVIQVPATMQAVYYLWGLYQPEVQNMPVADVRVREALSLAIDRQQIIDHIMEGGAKMPLPFSAFIYSLDMDMDRWQEWSRTALRYDPERAKELLAEAGYPDGFELNFANTALPGTPFMIDIGLAVADFWSQIGVKVNVRHYEWGAFRPLFQGETQRLDGWASMYRTAGRPLALVRYDSLTNDSDQRLMGDANHCNELCQKFNELRDKSRTEVDDKKRTEVTDQLIQLLADEWLAVPIIEGMGFWAVNPDKVGYFEPIPGRHEFGDLFERIPRPDQKPWQ